MKFFYSGQMMAMSVLFGTFEEIVAVTKLNGFGIVTYDVTYGLPQTIPIAFESDFPAALAGSASEGNVYFTYDVSGDAATYYTGHSLSINSAGPGTGELQIGLTVGVGPTVVGVYALTVAVDMFQKNIAGDTLMHMKTYTVTLNKQGSAVEYTVSSGAIGMPQSDVGTGTNIEDLPEDAIEDVANPNPQSFTTVIPQDLSIASGGGGGSEEVQPGEDIALTIGSEEPTFRVWYDSTAIIQVFSDSGLTNLVYEWPTTLVDAPTDEGSSSNYLTVNLESVPIGLYSLGTIYIEFVVKMRDTAGDAVRRLGTRDLQQKRGENRAEVVASVKFASVNDDESSANSIITTSRGLGLVAVGITGMVGTGILL